ncbi:Asp-tRNA(Asn)/Glu-tRNA(Gln) amidotransferase subunit GatB [Tautonia plasticadhaerens]|uniref:Aspartyl/glutamyl-tRNA(Asn/Gln) amidotransferase subunit B n=1 Tax=Tautonia plasticadhaerens TaxID=2527974 RepID=A0A518GXA0_9BACT|nr:Asp-tRNA(Asn)/Glu-tRNA(Gln) amidotransferase subunit GatB [Tautonia plasticadhaerens]QDV33217.1 Aspartyl/glutamyl-tRNA(Asn/Gln) amidotransferase subunit B [Tautonia plasticadhaerens]
MDATATSMDYDIIIGLEIHVQLQTESKMFSGCGTEFGLPPNTQTDPVSLGLPGTLPVMNGKAFNLALKTALAFGAEVARFTKWDRKNYYYPDLPKNYQISQYDLPFSTGGGLPIPARKDGGGGGDVRLTRIHLEEDTGKMIHAAGGMSEVDLNRAGVPLLEIVTEPDLRDPADARGCLEELRLTLRYLGVSDCEMQEGSLRCDANVNLHIRTADGRTVATPIVEIKNMNSFSAVEKALHYEVERQFKDWEETGLTIEDAPKQTRGWSDAAGETKVQREKETAADYRYFPEPDLVPVEVDDAWIARLRAEIGELPMARRSRFESEYGLSAYDANVLVEQGQDVADYFDAVAREAGEAKLASNWIQQDVLREIKEKKLALADFPVGPEALSDLIKRVKRKELNTNQGREVLSRMIDTGKPADAIIAEGGYGLIGDKDELAAVVASTIEANPKALEDLAGGKKKPEAVKGWLRGQVMKQTQGKADPALVVELLEARLAELGH